MPYDIVRKFEREVAEYAGAKFGVAVESGTAAIFLSLMYRASKSELGRVDRVTIPARTYPSVACSIIHAGGTPVFSKKDWSGVYELEPYVIIDGALRFKRRMYGGGLHCLSFHAKKHLAIGRGGMILTDEWDAVAWLRKARFDGRDECDLNAPQTLSLGWNMYMTPDQAARGLMAFSIIKNRKADPEDLDVKAQGYPDLSKVEAYRV